LTKRLRALLACVDSCRCLADIGTDHAYLPIEAVRKGICERAIACDIADGPLKAAAENIRAAGLLERIEMRLGDGVEPLAPGEADCIVIAGMGGQRIIDIVRHAHGKNRGNVSKVTHSLETLNNSGSTGKVGNARLILQAQHDLEELRRFLHENLYNIEYEKLVREGARFYVIIAAQRAEKIEPYTDAEYFTGRITCPDFPAYLCEKHAKISKYIGAISNENDRTLAFRRLSWLEGKI